MAGVIPYEGGRCFNDEEFDRIEEREELPEERTLMYEHIDDCLECSRTIMEAELLEVHTVEARR
jgi:hypothetical protein